MARRSRLAEREGQEPAALMARPRPRRKRTDRPRFTYRIDPSVHGEIHRVKREVEADGGFQTTIDQVAEDLLLAGIEAYDAGRAEISGRDLRVASRGKNSGLAEWGGCGGAGSMMNDE
jgi:hypothetical protein